MHSTLAHTQCTDHLDLKLILIQSILGLNVVIFSGSVFEVTCRHVLGTSGAQKTTNATCPPLLQLQWLSAHGLCQCL